MSRQKRRLSIITDILIFFILILIAIPILHFTNLTGILDNNEENFSFINFDTAESISDENILYIKKIQKDYGIKIRYGEDVKNYTDKVSATMQEDENIINNNLKIIYEALQKYPVDLFSKFQGKKYPIYIMLVDSFDNDNIALASRNRLNEFRMYISNNEKFERAFHHEMFHILEYYMIANEVELFLTWGNFNPTGFSYVKETDKLDKSYVYNNTKYDGMSTYFVTKYSKTTEKEDRAEIFAELMITNKKLDYLESGENIRKKADSILDTINDNITDTEFYCIRYLK